MAALQQEDTREQETVQSLEAIERHKLELQLPQEISVGSDGFHYEDDVDYIFENPTSIP